MILILFSIFNLFFHVESPLLCTDTETLVYATIKCTHTRRILKVDFLENKASNEKILFFIFDLFFHVESPSLHMYY